MILRLNSFATSCTGIDGGGGVLMPVEKFRSVMGHPNINIPINNLPKRLHQKTKSRKVFCSTRGLGQRQGR
jgi:hypothetical protein